MKIIPLTMMTTIILAGGAFASQTTGTITGISKKNDTITLSSGKLLHLPEGIEIETLSVGDTVKVSYKIGPHQQGVVRTLHTIH